MGVPFLPVFDRYAQVTGGIETITDQFAPNANGINGVGLVTGFIYAGNWQYCYSAPSTNWTLFYSSVMTGWSACYTTPSTAWSLVAGGV